MSVSCRVTKPVEDSIASFLGVACCVPRQKRTTEGVSKNDHAGDTAARWTEDNNSEKKDVARACVLIFFLFRFY